ncbi:Solute carrier family 25 member 40 [Trichinella nelsoni]|uniref:Solute carrier family 25 member 40 n=1 Tax=Trichinella nelsoni TaxID=6336 RepID=A0A0V0RK18_9BILA|nr:Solute carrier family 25 member 40 [Trichinella nelsoni]
MKFQLQEDFTMTEDGTADVEICDRQQANVVGITPAQRFIASCSGAVLTAVFGNANPLDVVKVRLQKQTKPMQVTPLDVVKIRLQSQSKPSLHGRCFVVNHGLVDHICMFCGSAFQKFEHNYRFNGTVDAFLKISKYEGISALWGGLSTTLIMAVPATICYFTLYDMVLSELKEKYGSQLWVPGLSGIVARMVSATVISPLEMVRTKLQAKRMRYSDVYAVLKTLTQRFGWRSLFLGLGPTLLRDVPFSAIYWTNYELMKEKVLKHLGREETNFTISLILGAISGSCAAVCTLPFDVVKTHRQISLGEMPLAMRSRMGMWIFSDSKPKTMSTFRSINNLFMEHGIRSLFLGIVPRLVKVAPACAIMIGTYEYGKLFFQRRNANGLLWKAPQNMVNNKNAKFAEEAFLQIEFLKFC